MRPRGERATEWGGVGIKHVGWKLTLLKVCRLVSLGRPAGG